MQPAINKGKNFQKIQKLCVVLLLIVVLFFRTTLSMAEIFCVQSQDEFISALNIASINGEDDILRIVQGTELGDVKLPSEPGYLIKIEGGYFTACTDGRELKQTSSEIIETSVEPANLPEPQQNTTGPSPPEEVEPKTAIFPGGALTGGADVTILGVPAYSWRHGCGPTAVGMVVGYWDENGYSDLFDGTASTQTDSVNQGIASQGSTTVPRHYEDYSLPEDTYPTMLPDKSELPSGDEHIDDSIADFMYTSWSSKNNYYGWSWSNHITPAFTNYARLRNSAYRSSTTEYYYSSTLTWDILTSEIDAKRPMVFLVDSSGNGNTDHFVTVVGYRIDGSTQYYGCLDTWYPYDTVRWELFRGMSSSYSWGVWGGYSFQLSYKSIVPILLLLLSPEPPDPLPTVMNDTGITWGGRLSGR